MADSTYYPRHTLLVRITHWIHTAAFFALIVSGAAILVAHPRLYWGESGGYPSAALVELPLPLNTDQSGWGRSLHFLAAWVCVIDGAFYVLSGIASRHFRNDLLPANREASNRDLKAYNPLQRFTYLAVIFFLFPLMISTGLAMSPAVSSVLPVMVGFFGGYQSSRTVHFFAADLLLLFLVVHIVMVYRAGFRSRMRGMITGRGAANVEAL